MPCLQCLNCQNDQQCEREAIYPKDYSNTLDQSCVSLVPSASALVATHIPNTPFSQAGLDSTIEIYMKNMLRPEAFTTSEQFTYPPAQLQEPMTASTWDANIDPNLPPLDPAILNHDNPYSAWPSSNVDIAHGVTTPQPEGLLTRNADS
ncbi:hypothetical protein F1880_002666 [Penicillium rolfsii]|nr:hypothetical protein F1880_002666 [Penicillium rolfsii]